MKAFPDNRRWRSGVGPGGSGWGGDGAGFTLLELIVAMAMFATVVVAVVTTFFAATDLRRHNAEAMGEVQRVQQALGYLKQDLRSMTIPSTNLIGFGLAFESGGEGEEEPLSLSGPMVTGSGLSPGDGSEFEFSTASGVLSDYEPWGSVQRVRYFLRRPLAHFGTNGLELVRGITRNVLGDALDAQYTEQLLLAGVRDLRFTFWDGVNWLDYWDSTSQEPYVPEAVRATIELMPPREAGIGRFVELLVPVSVRPLINALPELPGQGGGGQG